MAAGLWLLQLLWDVIGGFHEKQPGVIDKWGCWDVGLRVAVRQGTGVSECVSAQSETDSNDPTSPADLCFSEISHCFSCVSLAASLK